MKVYVFAVVDKLFWPIRFPLLAVVMDYSGSLLLLT